MVCSTATASDPQSQMQQMLQQQYDNSCISPVVINNNPKLKSLLEPFVIPAYGQLKQPNANSAFQSSIISANAINSHASGPSASSTASSLLTAVTQLTHNTISPIVGDASSTNTSNLSSGAASYAASASTLVGLAGSNLALVTENVTSFGMNRVSQLGR